MFVKRADEMRRAGEEVTTADGQVRTIRMLTDADGVGFGFSDVRLAAGADVTWQNGHHWQANHIISGSGEVTDMTTGQSWALGPSVSYNVGPKDRCRVKADTDVHLLSVSSPLLAGDERQDGD